YVLPPISSTSSSVPSQGSLDAYCYQYKYDTKNRLVEKKLPGKGWEYIVYDKLNRVVATGPALSPFTDSQGATGCMIVKYDVFGRVVLTGWMPTGADRATLQAGADGAAVFNETKTTSPTTVNQVAFSYTTGAWPTGNYHVLTVNYYDNYSSNLTFAPAISFVTGGYNNSDKLPKGLPTMSWARVCEASTNYRAEQSYIVYDKKGHVVTSYKDNYLGGYTKVESEVQAITGRVNQTITTHKKSSDIADETLAITDSLSYTDQDRLLKHLHKIGNGNWQLLSKNQYNALGQLISKRVGSKGNGDVDLGLQKVDYSYNVRGWLKGINNIGNLLEPGLNADLFAYKINYNATENPEGESQYNGNISEITWKTSDNIARRYNYSYDDLNRMTEGGYSTPDDNTNVFNFYGESVQYNKGGNIIGLQRREEAEGTSQTNVIDDLTYSYSGNKLMSVTESPYTSTGTGGFIDGNITGNDYDYDSFGNQIKDLNKGITQISYNHLNLPTKITFGTTGTIEYLYNATGQKVSKKVTEGATITETNYLDGFQYQNNELELFPHAGGYIKPMMVNNVFTYSYVFNYTDHLGNVRISYSDIDKNGILGPGVFSGGEDLGCIGSDCRVHFISSILEENNYYPFGLKHQGYNYSNGGNNYKFNGQEYQDELGLNTTAMDYRQYDNAIGRFNCIDPLAENHPDMTPYHFGANNPVYFSDPSGLDIILTGRNMVTFTGDEAGAFFNAWNSGGRTTVHNSQYNSIYTGAETAVDYAQTVLLDLQFGLLGGGGGGAYVALPEMVVPNGVSIDSDRFWNIAMGHTYWNSPYYDSWRGTQHANQWLDFGQGLQDVGDGMFMLGAGLSTTGIGATVGAPLITIGEGISTLGLGVKWTTNIVRGNFDLGNFVIDGALHLVPDQYEKAFGQGADYILIQMGSIGSGRWFDYMNSLHK
ncbi:MAG: RHS repeat domain-containing protein, partial [Flavobacterium sp.]